MGWAARRYPGRRFSPLRLLIALLVVAVLVGAAWAGTVYVRAASRTVSSPWTGGYVDVTATPSFAFESMTGEGNDNVVLSFLVAPAQDATSCAATWGGVLTPDQAASDLDLDRRVAELHRQGRTAVLSFGGLTGTDVAQACTDASDLADVYTRALTRYDTTALDLDLEGDVLSDSAALTRIAQALSQVGDTLEDQGDQLAVWLTLPADTSGLTDQGMAALQSVLEAGVTPAGVNLMTMDFNVASTTTDQETLVERSLQAGHEQVFRTLAAAGSFATSQQVWSMLGATVMIGTNDTSGEVFSLADARSLSSFAGSVGLGRLSTWSLNRDTQCGQNISPTDTAVDYCSGVEQSDQEFISILAAGRSGVATALPVDASVTPTPSSSPTPSTDVTDDPATSPYRVWDADTTYVKGTKVVWHHNVYVALWDTTGDQPDDPASASDAPWRLVGPVLAGETPSPTPTLAEGTYPDWDPDTAYEKGTRVLFDGVAFEARWWTKGDSPAAAEVDAAASPWRQLSGDGTSASPDTTR